MEKETKIQWGVQWYVLEGIRINMKKTEKVRVKYITNQI